MESCEVNLPLIKSNLQCKESVMMTSGLGVLFPPTWTSYMEESDYRKCSESKLNVN